MITVIFGARAGLRAVLAAAALTAALPLNVAFAQEEEGSQDLSWTPAPAEVATGAGVRIAVRLEDSSGLVTLPPEAVSEARIDMGPDGMAMMAAPLRPVAPEEGESLAWETDLRMAGRWALKVTAAVPGEAKPVTGEVIFTANEDE